MEAQKTLNSQSNPRQEELCKSYHNTWFQIILQSHSNENNMCWYKNRHIDPWNRNRWPQNKPIQLKPSGSQQSCHIHWRKDRFNKWWREKGTSTSKVKLDLCFLHCTKIHAKWIKDPKVTAKTLKLLD
jgi:hypothetical protein